MQNVSHQAKQSQQLAQSMARSMARVGLNLFAILDAEQIDDPAVPTGTRSLLLVGNSGPGLWACLSADDHLLEDPVDSFSTTSVQRILTEAIGDTGWSMLYPGRLSPGPVLQDLGRVAGWHHPSPLGSGIHPEHGLWFAYRAVVAFDFTLAKPVAQVAHKLTESPCLSCVDAPCVQSCPASALSVSGVPDLTACATFRIASESPCASRCIAREQCPIGLKSRYSDEQIQYFYRRSLPSLQQWVAGFSEPDCE